MLSPSQQAQQDKDQTLVVWKPSGEPGELSRQKAYYITQLLESCPSQTVHPWKKTMVCYKQHRTFTDSNQTVPAHTYTDINMSFLKIPKQI